MSSSSTKEPSTDTVDQNSIDNKRSVAYTVFTPRWRRSYLPYLLGIISLSSTMTATIYFPLLPLLSKQFSVSTQAINLTITLYVVFQAVSPAIVGTIADSVGRRPILLCLLFIYTAASLGLSLNQKSYATLLVLRALQSIGGSATVALTYGVVVDVGVPSERGSMVGPKTALTNAGATLGAVVGGGIAHGTLGTRWCFLALLIYAVIALLLVGFTLPETARRIVGNGSIRATGIWKAWPSGLGSFIEKDEIRPTEATAQMHQIRKIENPFKSLRIIFWPDTALILWAIAISYSAWYCLQTLLAQIFTEMYGYNELEVGLCFLPGGAGVVIGGYIFGQLMDWNYARTAKRHNFTVDRRAGDDLRNFPIEISRSEWSRAYFALLSALLVGYGWALKPARPVHVAVPLVLQAIICGICAGLWQTYSTLITDIFPENASASYAASNIARCGTAAIVVALIDPIVKRVGMSWYFTIQGLITGVSGILAVTLLRMRGKQWRDKRTKQAETQRYPPNQMSSRVTEKKLAVK